MRWRAQVAWAVMAVLLAATVVAGCGSNARQEGEAREDRAAATPAELRLATTWPYPYHGNPFGPNGVGGAWWFLYEPFAHYIPGSQQYVARLAESWSVEGRQITVRLRDGIRFSDGQPYTAEDVVSTITMIQAMWSWPYEIEAVEAPDARTVVFTIREGVDPQAALHTILTNGAIAALAPRHVYEPFLAEAKDVAELGKRIFYEESSGKTIEQAIKDEYKRKFDALRAKIDAFAPFKEKGTVPAVGPFVPAKVTQTEMVLEPNAYHWEKDSFKVSRIVFKSWSSNEFVWGALLAGELDAAHPAVPKDVVEQLEKLNPNIRVITVSDLSDVALLFNFRKPLFQDPVLRKAIAFALNRDKVRDVSAWQAKSYEETGHATGILASMEDQWLDDQVRSRLTPYRHDPAKAEALLREAGYRKEGGVWRTPGGVPVQFTISVYGPHNDWVLAAREVAEQLKAFGFKVDLKLIPEGLRDQVILGGDFDVAVDFGSAWWGFPHPVTGFERLYRGDVARATGFPVDRPSPDLGGATPEEAVRMLAQQPTAADVKERVAALAAFTHEQLPVVPLYEKVLPIYVSTARFTGWPEPGDPLWSLAPGGIERVYLLLVTSGRLAPR